MRVLVIHAHPDPESYNAALNRATVETLAAAGHEVDACDLHAEGFTPVLTTQERRDYHDPAINRAGCEDYVARTLAAEAIVLVFPVWNFGYPAILKGYFDRVWLPGVSFHIVDGIVRPGLTNVRKIAAVTTYGGTRVRAMLAGDPPRKAVTRVMRAMVHPLASTTYLAHYDMNRSTDATRAAFLAKVRERLARF